MQSPAAQFITDIVGAKDVINGKATKASGVRVQGDKLIIKLTEPDGGLLAKLGTPFFQAIPTNLPIDPKGVLTYPSAGPYYFGEPSGRPLDRAQEEPALHAGRGRRTSTPTTSTSTRT